MTAIQSLPEETVVSDLGPALYWEAVKDQVSEEEA